MRVKAGNSLSSDAVVIDLGASASLSETDGHVSVSGLGGGAQTLSSVLADGNDAAGLSITGLGNLVFTGLTGATASVRFVGGTTTGAPLSGTFAIGDAVITQDGRIFVCTVAGTPGTWVDAGAATDATITTTDVTTNNSSTLKHGFLKKLDNNAAHYMDGTGGWSTPSGGGTQGTEIGYDQVTTSVTVSSTTEATGTSVIACAAHTFDGAAVMAEFFCPDAAPGTADFMVVNLMEGATQIGRLAVASVGPASATLALALTGKLRFTPTAASHTYTVTAWRGSVNGTLAGGVSGTGAYVPMYMRFTKV